MTAAAIEALEERELAADGRRRGGRRHRARQGARVTSGALECDDETTTIRGAGCAREGGTA